ncbi:MAG: glutamine synthetase III [Clostridia bacterium]|nr:glutamine synthetase III [Clostridia bacterium]
MSITEIFATNVFNEEVMKASLSSETFNSLNKTVEEGAPLDITVANEVASAMKDWAISKGATHFSHWFQPMTGITAEKHDSFISAPQGGKVILEFSGKELIKGESDASSFPNGGIRATFEARGFTAWDPTSYAFIKDKTLYIPTAFCAFNGEALDKKTPLLRSVEALNKQAMRVLRLLGNTTAKSVKVSIGAEQEYFLIDKKMGLLRPDLVFTGRTLFGAKPPKGQELEDHYFGSIKPRVKSFMEELDEELWKLGIPVKTEHNEAAPAQHEIAPIYSSVNVATDNNQLIMDLMKKTADKHGLICLLHEKPFAGVAGSGKHNNWSIETSDGENLLKPGKTPSENLQFLLFLASVIKAADDYQDLYRSAVASAGNDHRLGASEAPPAIISVYLGEDLLSALKALENHDLYKTTKTKMSLGVKILPTLSKDATDRNRTSPLAYTGNKFEFRMVGASDSTADSSVVLNVTVAESLRLFADELEKATDIEKAVHDIVVNTVKKHKRILFTGNNYATEWTEEAEKRGLKNLRSTPEAASILTDEKNVLLYERHKVFSYTEIASRQQIMFENYSRVINIEALTVVDMAKKNIFPAINSYVNDIINGINAKKSVGIDAYEDLRLSKKLSNLNSQIYVATEKLERLIVEAKKIKDAKTQAFYYHDEILSLMKEIRSYADEAEKNTASNVWPYPSYSDLLFSVN